MTEKEILEVILNMAVDKNVPIDVIH